MTVKLIALYRKPEYELAFLQHYYEVHLPLKMKTPHLIKIDVNRITTSVSSDHDYCLIDQMYFPDRHCFDEAMASAENHLVEKDRKAFEKILVALLLAE